MFKLSIIILIVMAALGASVLGYFIVKDIRGDKEAVKVEEKAEVTEKAKKNKTTAVSPPELLGGETAKSLPPLPDLDRKIVYKALIREEDKPKLESEIKIVSQTLKENPDYLQGWLQLGLLRKYIGDYEGAALVWEYASKIRPQDFVAFNNLGDLYNFYLKDFAKSEAAIKKVIELRPDYVQAYRNLFELYTLSYKAKENLAAEALKDGIAKNPKAYDLMAALAMYLKERGDKVGAKEYLEMAIRLNPPNKSALEAALKSI